MSGFTISGLSQNKHQTYSSKELAAADEHVSKSDENVKRGNWPTKTDYLLSVIGCAVGLGNVWRFPYLAYRNGGGAFLIPYTLMLALVGMPMFFLESSFGQFASLGPVAIWKAVPMLQGVGIAMVLVATIGDISYCCIIGYSLYYLFASFQSPLPWADCFSWWGADETCSRTPKGPVCNLTLDDGYFEIVNTTWLQANNETCPNGSAISVPHHGPSEQYWDKVVLHRTSSMDEAGGIVWYLALCLLLAWLIVGAALSKGIKSSGKAVYFTATFPYVVLTILLIRGVTLEGAGKGIEFYIGSQSDFSKLADAEVWKDAATQIFFSLTIGWGSLITLSSYNKFRNNCYRDAIIVCVVNSLTSVFAGFVIFSILGHMAHIQDKPVSEIAQSESVITAIVDVFPRVLRSRRLFLTIFVCSLFFFCGLLCVTQAGIYWLNLIDHFCTGLATIITALLELIGLSWIYGINRFIKDIEMMIGEKNWLFWLWWRMCWIFMTPCLLAAILFWSLAMFVLPTYGPVEYPVWAIALGWCMIIFCIMWIPIVAVVRVVQAEGSTLWQKITGACSSAKDWGPCLEQHKGERYENKHDSAEALNSVKLLLTPEEEENLFDL
ncbi:sodium- and chloride-dependent neutral and basic amino acid transporter B(0+)-like isoform X2 [Stegostoma tigrinum]|uniref:sodium- and chloride-dependent neutral and basic amino acid transporter B(0+)-like isoform X2 n=1 Tax=Stegostoma tigrinum TaxID=3053191 RepID=UPI00202B9606|nr:sodium- and chloride-dependent neutral and basic amino acid transporter B(0+)-like isoform X2 [Stegostoma tigrinum]